MLPPRPLQRRTLSQQHQRQTTHQISNTNSRSISQAENALNSSRSTSRARWKISEHWPIVAGSGRLHLSAIGRPKVNYWFGNFADKHAAWIKSIVILNYDVQFRPTNWHHLPDNFLRLFTAVTQGKSAFIDTYVYVGCNYDWSIWFIACIPGNDIFNFNNRYGWFWRWVRYALKWLHFLWCGF